MYSAVKETNSRFSVGCLFDLSTLNSSEIEDKGAVIPP